MINSELEKMHDRWLEKKPKDRDNFNYQEALGICESINDINTQWTELDTRIQKLYTDAKHFGKATPKLQYYDIM